jgi:hypothetical protein
LVFEAAGDVFNMPAILFTADFPRLMIAIFSRKSSVTAVCSLKTHNSWRRITAV